MNTPTNSSGHTERQIHMAKRERIKLTRMQGDRNRTEESSSLILWFDSKKSDPSAPDRGVFSRIAQSGYTGVVLYPETLPTFEPLVHPRLTKIIHLKSEAEFLAFPFAPEKNWIVASPDLSVLEAASRQGLTTCYRAFVDDGQSLNRSIELGCGFDYLLVSFQDPTNIPLELVIATLQGTDTVLIKEITGANANEDALVTLGVMEVGAEGVMFSPETHADLDGFLKNLKQKNVPKLPLQIGTVIRSEPVGMGYRSCIDLATLFAPTEGMLVGSTSQGGILCCPEVYFLPYMELRPFRVNAGAVHSYVYNVDNRTDYMTELRAGTSVMVVNCDGTIRNACVGRMKTEVRPMRLIEVEFAGGERVNVMMQDDWHVRIFSDQSLPLNITELKPGDKVLGHVAEPGRHVGIKVDEHIVEN